MNERIQLRPMIEEIFTDLAPLSDKLGVTLTAEGDGIMTGSDALIYRLIQPDGECCQGTGRPVRVSSPGVGKAPAPRLRHRLRHPGGVSAQYFPALLPGDKSRGREYGGAGLGLSPVWRSPTSTAARLGGESSGEGHYHCGGVTTQQRSPKTLLFVSAVYALRRPPYFTLQPPARAAVDRP